MNNEDIKTELEQAAAASPTIERKVEVTTDERFTAINVIAELVQRVEKLEYEQSAHGVLFSCLLERHNIAAKHVDELIASIVPIKVMNGRDVKQVANLGEVVETLKLVRYALIDEGNIDDWGYNKRLLVAEEQKKQEAANGAVDPGTNNPLVN